MFRYKVMKDNLLIADFQKVIIPLFQKIPIIKSETDQ